MRVPPTVTGPLGAGAVLLVAAAAAWGWRQHVLTSAEAGLETDPWQHVREQYPSPTDGPEPPGLTTDAVESLARADPFSPMRHVSRTPAPGDDAAPGQPPPPSTPQFVYKGRIQIGSRQRAIVEETTSHKTHFLEVGQEVAGFKLLDIAEERVLLSDLQAQKEVAVPRTSTPKP
jgi:hypothetical protein